MNAPLTRDLFGEAIAEASEKILPCLPPRGSYPAAKVPPIVVPPPKNGPRRVVSVDSFAGCGGASSGIELALETLEALGLLPKGHGLKVNFAINHDEAAIRLHEENYPETIHLPHNVWKVSLLELLGDNFFGLLWLSPDCRDHSNAKGGPITSRSVRDLAWVLVRWLKELPDWQRPWCIFLENVPAFSQWSPLIPQTDGTYVRDPARKGELFHRFIKVVCGFGYSAGWEEIRACDFGDPTIRKRLKLVFRRDAQPVEWMEPTHGDPASEQVKSGELEPWPVAADIIDFSLDCPSIFMTREEAREYTRRTGKRIVRPLAGKTDARLAKGVKRHVIDTAEPFVVSMAHGDSGGRREYGLGEPLTTVQPHGNKHGLVVPTLSAYYGPGAGSIDRSAPVDRPITTVPTEPRHAFIETSIAPCIVGVGGRMGQSSPRPVTKPWQAVTTKPDAAMAAAQLAPLITIFRGDQIGKSVSVPLPTATANSFIKRPGGASPLAITAATLAPFLSRGQHGGGNRPVDEPHSTIAASDGDQNQIVVPYLVPRYGERDGQEPRSLAATRPMPTPVPSSNQGNLAAVYLAQHNTGLVGHSVEEAVSTIVQKGCTQGLVAATFIKREFGNSIGSSASAPLGAVMAGGGGKTQLVAAMLSHSFTSNTAGGRGDLRRPQNTILAGGNHANLVTLPLMTAYYSNGGQHAGADDPMLAVPTKARFGLTQADATPSPLTEAQWRRARQVADFLRRHGCWDGGDVVTITIRGDVFIIVDIGMRMLTPRELARAQGFPDWFKLAVPYKGGMLSETEQRHKIGNSVCRRPAAAVIISNYRPPMEWGFEEELREAA